MALNGIVVVAYIIDILYCTNLNIGVLGFKMCQTLLEKPEALTMVGRIILTIISCN